MSTRTAFLSVSIRHMGFAVSALAAATQLDSDSNATVWQRSFVLPPGSWEFTAALDGVAHGVSVSLMPASL